MPSAPKRSVEPTLNSVTVERYRSFEAPTPFEIRPLTLLYGQNNAGKSALLRLLPILAASVEDNPSGTLELNADAASGAGFRELAWAGERRCHLTLHWSRLKARYTIELAENSELMQVKTLELTDSREGQAQPYVFVIAVNGRGYTVGPSLKDSDTSMPELHFRGLLPVLDAETGGQELAERQSARTALESLKQHLLPLRGKVAYLNARRGDMPREVTIRGLRPTTLKANGENVSEMLVSDGGLLKRVARWYGQERVGRRLEVMDVSKTTRQLFLGPHAGPLLNIPLCEAGEGMKHVLPVLVALALAEKQQRHSLLTIEEPESHLHDDAQRLLGEELCRVAALHDSARIVAETHSRLLLLGVQWAVTQKQISKEDVMVYWVEQWEGRSRLVPITIREDGSLNGWPPRVFEEDLRLGRDLLQWQLDQEDKRREAP